MILETICKEGHVEHVEPSVERPAAGIYIWGSAADFCQRKLPGGLLCEAPVVHSWYLRDDQRIQVIGGCGIDEPHAPGMHAPPIDLTPDEEEPDETQGCWHYDYTRFCTQCDPASYESDAEEDNLELGDEDEDLGVIGRGIAQRAAEARARIFGGKYYPALALIAAAALASLGLTILFTLQGHWVLALLV